MAHSGNGTGRIAQVDGIVRDERTALAVRTALALRIIFCLSPSEAWSIPPSSFWEWLPVGLSVSSGSRPGAQASSVCPPVSHS